GALVPVRPDFIGVVCAASLSLVVPVPLIAQTPGPVGQTPAEACRPAQGDPVPLEGSVSDASGGAVAAARVTVVACGDPVASTQTDPQGRYRVLVRPGTYDVLVERAGFELATAPVIVAAAQGARQDHTLQMATLAEAVTVTAGGFEQLVRQAPASVTVIDSETLRTRRVGNLAEALAEVEGVDSGQDVGKTGGPIISLRGMPSDYTLMLVDGRRQNPAGNVTPNGFTETSTSFMPPVGAIERIEVVRGPMSTLYGSDAMGGVVNVV